MNFFGMGSWEILIILIAALIIFGPGRLPEVAGQAGRWIRDLRRMTTDLSDEFERTAGVQELKSAVRGEIANVKSEVNAVSGSVKRDLKAAASTSSTTVASTAKAPAAKTTSATTVSKATTSSSSTAKAAAPPAPPKATKRDPLADVSFMEPVGPAASANGAEKPAAASRRTEPAAPAPTTAADQQDALARARQRRLAAGYNRRSL
jgi:Tat protein translocase TatB subunit